jgi:hypothetical protein
MFVLVTPTLMSVRADKSGATSASGAGFDGSTQITHGVSLGTTTAHHMVISAGSTGAKYYIDGALVGTVTGVTFSNVGFHNTTLGIWYDGVSPRTPGFDGTLSEVRTYNRMLSAADVSAAYSAGRNRASMTSGTTGAWNLQEGTGTTITDSSGNNRTGTIGAGFTWTVVP